MKRFAFVLAGLAFVSPLWGGDLIKGDFHLIEKKAEKIVLPKAVSYLTLDEGLAQAKQKGIGLMVARKTLKKHLAYYAKEADKRGLIFCVSADNDVRALEGVWAYDWDALPGQPAIQSQTPPPVQPMYFFPQQSQGRSC